MIERKKKKLEILSITGCLFKIRSIKLSIKRGEKNLKKSAMLFGKIDMEVDGISN